MYAKETALAVLMPELAGEEPNERDVVDADRRDAPRESLSRALDARDVVVRQQVVDPFRVGSGRKSSNINVIDAVPNYPQYKG